MMPPARPRTDSPTVKRRSLRLGIALLAMASLAAWPLADMQGVRETTHGSGADRNALWRLVHDGCVPASMRGAYPPAPCTEVDVAGGTTGAYAVLKDRVGRYQYLFTPLARVTGIESTDLLAPDAPNYFAAAWTARLYVEAALHRPLPRDALALAVNSTHARSQDQLHIHIDCVRSDVHEALRQVLPVLTEQWRPLGKPLPPNGHAYRARWARGEILSLDPFRSLAAALPAGDAMARHSLVLVGAHSATGEPGFILLSSRVDPSSGDRGSGEELQDHACAVGMALPRHPATSLPRGS